MSHGDAELDRFYEAYKRIVWPFHYILPRDLREVLEAYGACGAYQLGLSLYDYTPKGNGYWQRGLRWLFPMLTEFEQSDFYNHMEQLYRAEILTPRKPTESDYAHNVGNRALGAYLRHTNRSGFVEILLFIKEKNIFPDGENEDKFLDKICDRTHRSGSYGDRSRRFYDRFFSCENKTQVEIEKTNLELMKICLIAMDTLGLLVDPAEGVKNFELMLAHHNPDDLLNICLLLLEMLKQEEQSQTLRQSIFTIISKHTSLEYVSGSWDLLEQVGRDRYSTISLYYLLKHASKKPFMSFQFLLMMAKSPDPVSIYNALFLLDKKNIISHPAIVKNLPHILEHKKPKEVIETLVHYEQEIFVLPNIDDYIQFIVKSVNPRDMADALVVFIKAGMVNDSTWTRYFKDILQPYYKEDYGYRRIMAQGMHNLENHGMLNQRHVDFIAGDSAISYSTLLVELNKSGLFQPQNAEHYLNMLENHKNPLSLTRALILREHYKVRFTQNDYDAAISDDMLMTCYHAAFQVQWIALKRFLSAFEDHSKGIECFIAKIDEQLYIPLSYPPLNNLFRLDRKGQLALKGESAMLALLKNINQNIDSWENDFSDPEPESDSDADADADAETNRFFNQKWCWNGLSIFKRREYARHQLESDQQLMAVERRLDNSMT